MPKNKPRKGMLKRMRFTKSGKVKVRRTYGRHKRSHKSSTLLQSYRKPQYAKRGDARRVRAMLFTSVRTAEQAHAAPEADASSSSGSETRRPGQASGESSES